MANEIKIALAGNPNCGKTTLFNALTGSNQFVGNWPGVTVEKKEGKLKKHDNVVIMDLPGIYSLSPYTLEEVVARNYLIGERPDAILNIIDGTNLERNLYLTTQLTELGIPVVVAVNMMDIVRKNGDKLNIEELGRELGCEVVEISALKNEGITDAAEAAIRAAESTKTVPMHTFSGVVEHALAHIEEAAVHSMPAEQQRWYAIKIFERDEKVLEMLKIEKSVLEHIENDIKAAEEELAAAEQAEAESEMQLLIRSLEERQRKDAYEQIKLAAGSLGARNEIGLGLFTKTPEPLQKEQGYRYQHEVKDLLRALELISERSRRQLPPPTQNFKGIVGKEPYPIGRKTGEVLRQLVLRGMERLKNLFRGNKSRS